MGRNLTAFLLGLYFFIYVTPQYIQNVYYAYDRVTIQIFLLSILNTVVFCLLVKNSKLNSLITLFKSNYHLISFALVIIIAFISLIVAENKTEGAIVLSHFLTLFMSFVLIVILSQHSKLNFLKLFLYFSVIGLILESTRTNWLIFDNVINNGKILERTLDYRGFTGNINISSFSLAIKLPVLIYLVFTVQNKISKSFFLIVLSSSLLAILLLFSRAAIIALILVLISLMLFVVINRSRVYVTNFFLILLASSFSFVSYNLINEKNTSDLIIDRFSTVTNPGADESVNERLNFYKIAINDITTYPVLGVGIGNWKLTSIQRANKFLAGYRIPFRVHNDFLEVAAEIGIIGGLLFVYFIFFPFISSLINTLRTNKFEISFLIFLIVGVYIMDSLLNFPMHRPIIIIYLLFTFALFYNIKSKNL
jgi:O-antigen ligase